MTIIYSLGEEDFVYIWRYAGSRPGNFNRSLAIVAGIFFTGIGLLAMMSILFLGFPRDVTDIVFTLLTLSGGFRFLYDVARRTAWYGRRQFRKQFRNGSTSWDCTLQLHPEYIEVTADGNTNKTAWTDVVNVIDEKRYVFILTVDGRKMSGSYVPKQAFTSPEAAERFYQAAYAYWKSEPPPEADAGVVWPPPPRIERS